MIIEGLILGIIVAGLAYKVGALSRSGAIAAVLEGTIIFGFGLLPGAILLLAFFVSSSALSRLFRQRKAGAEEKYAKGSQRDAGQVLANGGIPTLMMLLHGLYPDSAWPWFGFAASLAAANADTWATELGVLSRALPRLVTNGRPVLPGTSGAVSLVGTAAALAGAGLIAWLGAGLFDFVHRQAVQLLPFVALVSLAGVAGAVIDSLLGATLQSIYYCPACEKETERHPEHACGTPTRPLRGWRWLNNDWVNALSAAVAAGLAVAVWLLAPGWFVG